MYAEQARAASQRDALRTLCMHSHGGQGIEDGLEELYREVNEGRIVETSGT